MTCSAEASVKLSVSLDTRIVTAYQGTSYERAEAAVETQRLHISHNPWDWLGYGAYFWEDSFERAMIWAYQKYQDKAAVFHTRIRLRYCLDLFDVRWAPALLAAYEKFASYSESEGLPLPTNKGGNHALDRAVINYLCEDVYDIDTVRGPFTEGPPLFPGSMLPNLTHVQIAVRNTASIISPIEFSYPFTSSQVK